MCRRYHVEMKSPPGIDVFLQQVDDYTKHKGKAVHLLFNDIESDIQEKFTFLTNQSRLIESMVESYKNLIAQINILKRSALLFNLNFDF